MQRCSRFFLAACAAAALAAAGCGGDPNAADSGAAPAAGDRADGPLVLALGQEIPPYVVIDRESGEVHGIDVDIVRAAAERLGRKLVFRLMPFVEILPAVKDGKADFAAAAITITEGRKHDVDFSDSYAEEGCAFLYRSGEEPPTMIRAESLRVGVVESVTPDFYLTRHGLEPFRFKALPEIVAEVAAGRLDAAFYDRPGLVLAAEPYGGALAVTPLETREHYGIAVQKGRPELLEAVNAAIRERREAAK